MTIYLTGFMGAGKTTVGRALAERLNLAFFDLDREIEVAVGASVGEIFEAKGEVGFREHEAELLRSVCRGRAGVVATGGGTPVDPLNRDWMRRHGTIVWLDTDLELMIERTRAGGDGGDGGDRPLLGDAEQARRLYRRRLDAYGDCDLRVEIGPGGVAGAGDLEDVAEVADVADVVQQVVDELASARRGG